MKRVENLLLFLTLLFLPTQLGKHFWPDFSYVYSLKIDYLSPVIYFWDLLVILLLLTWMMQKHKVNKVALNLFFFFLLTQILSFLKIQNPGAGMVRIEQYTVAGLFGIYLASSFKRKSVFLPLLLGATGESIIGILQFIHRGTLGLWFLGERSFNIATPAIAKFDFYGMQFLRPYATFPHPNVLSAYLLIVAILLRKTKNSFLSALTILLAMSRTAIFAGLMLLLFFKRKWAILLILLLTPILFVRFSSILNFDNLTLLRREELMGTAWQLFQKSPIFGVGLNNFIPAVASNLLSGPNRFLQPVHNIFFLSLAETGILGFIGFIVLMGYPMKFIVYRLSFVVKTRALSPIYDIRYTIVPWLIIFFLGMFDHYFLTLPQGYRLLFLVWGLSFSDKITK